MILALTKPVIPGVVELRVYGLGSMEHKSRGLDESLLVHDT